MRENVLHLTRTITLGFFLAVMVSLVLPAFMGTHIAHANPGFGTEVIGSEAANGNKATPSPPENNSPSNPTVTAGQGVHNPLSCAGGVRPSGIRPPSAVASCAPNVADLRVAGGSRPPGNTCSTSTPGVVGVSWMSAMWRDVTPDGDDSLLTGSYETGNISCISISYTEPTFVCLNNATVNINKFLPNAQTLSSVRANTSWGDGNHSYASCYNSNRLQASSYVPIVDYGRYSAQFNLYGNVVRFRVYGPDPFTGVTPAPEILADSGPQLRKTGVQYLQYTCDNAIQSPSNSFGGSWTWTENDCAEGNPNGNTPTFQCVNMEAPTVNGVPQSQINQILRDGNPNVIAWGVPNVVGPSLRNLTNPSTTLTVSGTPTFANDQLTITRGGAKLTPAPNYTNSIATEYELRARWASDKNNPITLNQSYSWLGTWEKTSYAITGVDFDAEDFVITPITVNTQSPVTCNPANVSFDVLRATNG